MSKLACTLSLVLATSGSLSAQNPKWLLVRSDAPTLVSFSWDRLAKAYLGTDYLIVRAGDADKHPASSRLVVGTPEDNALVARLAKQLGVAYEGKRVRYKGRLYPGNAGLCIVTDDPDGKGTLCLMTGATPNGAFNCLSVRIDLGRPGFVAMTFRHPIQRGAVGRPFQVAGDRLLVIRLDHDLWRIRDALAGISIDEAALRASRALKGYEIVYERAFGGDFDLLEFTRRQLRKDAKRLDATRKRFEKLDLAHELDELDKKVTNALGPRKGPRPIVYTPVIGFPGTNAQTIDPDPFTGRPRITLNLAAFATAESLRLAATHELVHTLQTSHGGSLLARAVHEGVATYVSQQLIGSADHEALMWTKDQLRSARNRQAAIIAAFDRMKDETDMRRIGDFLYGGRPLQAVRGAPDRSGYFVGWLAVAAWRNANPKRPLGDLLRVAPQAMFDALKPGK